MSNEKDGIEWDSIREPEKVIDSNSMTLYNAGSIV
jgi:hypothetical protein